jgi:hypothetical protein
MSVGRRTATLYPEDGGKPGKPVIFDTADGLLEHVRAFQESGQPGRLHVHLPSDVAEAEAPAVGALGANLV